MAFTLFGPRWDVSDHVSSVTWAVDTTIPASFLPDIARAFASWTQYANITFQQVAPGTGAEIVFSNTNIDGVSCILGQATTYYTGTEYSRGTVQFDSSEGWRSVNGRTENAGGNSNLYTVALHEIGHSIGINHNSSAMMVMNSSISTSVFDLTANDILAAQSLYGARLGAPAFTTHTGLLHQNGTATPVNPAAGGTGSVAPNSPIVVADNDSTDPVFRFYNTATGSHFYTESVAERDSIIRNLPTYNFEGVAFESPDEGVGTIDVFRFYNTATNSHFFTTSVAERDQVVRTLPTFRYEGVAFEAYASAAHPDALVLDRFYNSATNKHHYSNGGETQAILGGSAGPNWRLEGPGFIMARIGSDWRVEDGVLKDAVFDLGFEDEHEAMETAHAVDTFGAAQAAEPQGFFKAAFDPAQQAIVSGQFFF